MVRWAFACPSGTLVARDRQSGEDTGRKDTEKEREAVHLVTKKVSPTVRSPMTIQETTSNIDDDTRDVNVHHHQR